jgi:hypothetical protein
VIWRPIDSFADWLRHSLGFRAQLRLGVLFMVGSVPFLFWMPFAGEPPVIYFMSWLAIFGTGLALIITAEVGEVAEEAAQEAP